MPSAPRASGDAVGVNRGGAFPPGLNDCVSGLKWVIAHADRIGVDPGRVIVAGESGGGI